MMTEGRLRAVKHYYAERRMNHELMARCVGELIAEVERLRSVLQIIANGQPTTKPARTGEGDLDQAYNLQATAAAALKEPAIGRPDFICRG